MCIFCKIINNEIPSYKVYEDEYVLAILDISQVCDGHTLILPKKHYDNFLDADLQTIDRCMNVIKILSNKYKKILNPKGFNILNNNNKIAGQTVFHLHFHLIPRYDENDEIDISFNRKKPFDLAKIHEILK